MIDISSLPEHELTGLEGFEAKELYKVIRFTWLNHRYLDYAVSGVFLDHETARSFTEAMAKREERIAEEEAGVKDYKIFWDKDSNCDDGFSIITYMDHGDEWCSDYAIEKVPLWYKPCGKHRHPGWFTWTVRN